MELQGAVLSDQGSKGRALATETEAPEPAVRLRELEAENARLKSLVGELLVANQLLRERRELGTGVRE